ncbi:PEP-CTERM sorting domain-containing protein, partial [Sphingomonas sp. CFBP 13706]
PTAAVPEAGTWAIMLFGIGGIGASMRVRRRQTKIAFA